MSKLTLHGCWILLAVANAAYAETESARQPAATQASALRAETVPPSRPLPLTVEQIRALADLAVTPMHAVHAELRAAYSPDKRWAPSEIGAKAFYAGYAGTIITILIAAAPL